MNFQCWLAKMRYCSNNGWLVTRTINFLAKTDILQPMNEKWSEWTMSQEPMKCQWNEMNNAAWVRMNVNRGRCDQITCPWSNTGTFAIPVNIHPYLSTEEFSPREPEDFAVIRNTFITILLIVLQKLRLKVWEIDFSNDYRSLTRSEIKNGQDWCLGWLWSYSRRLISSLFNPFTDLFTGL